MLGLFERLPLHFCASSSMRKVIFGGANSLDNFLARPDGGIDWLMWNEEVSEIMSTFWKTVDTVLVGRKTYEVSLAMGGGGGPVSGLTSYVFSRTLKKVEGGAILVSENADAFIRDLKQQPGKDICVMGGGEFGQFLFDAELIDVVGVNIHPLLLGGGVPLFHKLKKQVNLALTECRQLKNGCVYLTYNVKR
jgi:dihydrofolate reductase